MPRSTVIDNDPFTEIGNALSELAVLHELCVRSEAALQRELQELHDQMDGDTAQLSERELEGYLSDINDHYIMVSEELPLYQNYSNFVIGFAVFEKCLNDVCEGVRRRLSLKLALKDVYGQGLPRAKTFLSKVANITTPFETAAWGRIVLLVEIRNAIVHRGGYVDYRPDDKKSAFFRLNVMDGVELVDEVMNQPDRQIRFDRPFVTAALSAFDDLLRALWEVLPNRS